MAPLNETGSLRPRRRLRPNSWDYDHDPSNSSVHHYECAALCKDIGLQRGRYRARSLTSCIPRSSEDRSSRMFFIQVVCAAAPVVASSFLEEVRKPRPRRFGAWRLRSSHPTLCCKETEVSKRTFVWNFDPNCSGGSYHEQCCKWRLLSTDVLEKSRRSEGLWDLVFHYLLRPDSLRFLLLLLAYSDCHPSAGNYHGKSRCCYRIKQRPKSSVEKRKQKKKNAQLHKSERQRIEKNTTA